MKIYTLLLLLILTSLKSHAQGYFEGKIIYTNTFQSKLENVSADLMKTLVGSKLEYFVKEGNYKSYNDGKSITVQLYDNKSNRLYNKTSLSDTLYWFDASINTDSVINYEVIKNKDKVLGYECDALVLNTKSAQTTFYYSSKFVVNDLLYKAHNYNFWNYFLSKSKALPLKIVIENAQFKMESTAEKTEQMDLPDDFFNIGPTVPVVKAK